MKSVAIFTDGACSGNPGPGGCAALLVHGEHRRELSRGYRWTTNNRMEMMALVIALEALKYECAISIHSDSKYLLRAFEDGWLDRWKRTGWRTKSKEPVRNVDLWKRLDELLARHEAEFNWIKGHSGHAENSRCDELAVAASKEQKLIDEEFEATNPFKPKPDKPAPAGASGDNAYGKCDGDPIAPAPATPIAP